MDLSTQNLCYPGKSRDLTQTKVVELPDEGVCFPLKSEYDRANCTLEGIRRNNPPSALDMPEVEDYSNVEVRVVPKS